MKLSNVYCMTDSKTFVLLAIRKAPFNIPIFSLSTVSKNDTFEIGKGVIVAALRYALNIPHPRTDEYTNKYYVAMAHECTVIRKVEISSIYIAVAFLVALVHRLKRPHHWWKVFDRAYVTGIVR